MSFVSSVIIGMIEKELAEQTPEVEAFALSTIGEIAGDIVAYIEKKISGKSQAIASQESSSE